MQNENTASRLKKIMKEKRLRQVDILNTAQMYCKKYNIKLNKSDLSQYLSGKAVPSRDKLVVLSMALGVSEAWLMGLNVPRNDTAMTQLSTPDTILFEITPRSLRNSPKIADVIVQNAKEILEYSEPNPLSDILNLEAAYREKANVLNTLIDYVIYNPTTNHVDIVFLTEERDALDRMFDMLICPVRAQELVYNFETLNTLGQNKILDNVKDLTYIDRYKKEVK